MTENIMGRIKQYLDFKGISNRQLELSTGMSNGSFSSQLKKNKTIGVDRLENILNTYDDINPEWLLTGKGSMLRQTKVSKTSNINSDNVIGSNVNSPGSYTNESSAELIEIIKKQQEQMDKLINIINKSNL